MDQARQVTERLLKYGQFMIESGIVLDTRQLAEAAGMTYQRWYLIAHNPQRNFTIQQLQKLGKRYNLDMNYFFFGEGEPQRIPNNKMGVVDILKSAIAKLEAVERENSRMNTIKGTKIIKKTK